VDRLVSEVSGAQRQKSAMSNNLAEYGLDSPREVVTLKRGGQEWSLNVGKESSGSGVVYVAHAGNPQEPMAVRKTEIDTVFSPANAFRDHDLLTSGNEATDISLDAKGQTLELAKKGESEWRFVKPPYGPANPSGASPMGFPPAAADKKMDGVR